MAYVAIASRGAVTAYWRDDNVVYIVGAEGFSQSDWMALATEVVGEDFADLDWDYHVTEDDREAWSFVVSPKTHDTQVVSSADAH